MDFLKRVFSESSEPGSPSFSRLASGAALLAVIAWGTRIVWRTDALPDLFGPALFISSLYGINRASDILTLFRRDRDK